MHLFFIVILVGFFIFLFTLHYLSNDDLIIIRKDMPMEKVFNSAFLAGLVGLLFSRIFYVIIHPEPVFLNPLGFLLFPYFPGLALSGAVIGGFIFLVFYARNQKLPVGRLFDFFSIAILSSLPFGYLGLFLLGGISVIGFIFSFIAYGILFFAFIKFLLPMSFRNKIKNGSIFAIFLFSFALVAFLTKVLEEYKNINIINPENFLFLGIFIFSLVIILKTEILGKRIRK